MTERRRGRPAENRQHQEKGREKLLLLMTVCGPARSLKGRGSCRRAVTRGRGTEAAGCFYVFDVKTDRGVQRERERRLIQKVPARELLMAEPSGANISWFRQLFLGQNWPGAVLHFWSTPDEPSLHARHSAPDCTSPQREHRLQKVCISLWLFHSVCCDAGNRRAAMCRDTSTLLSQTAAGMSANLSASHLCHASAHSPPPSIPPPTTQN